MMCCSKGYDGYYRCTRRLLFLMSLVYKLFLDHIISVLILLHCLERQNVLLRERKIKKLNHIFTVYAKKIVLKNLFMLTVHTVNNT